MHKFSILIDLFKSKMKAMLPQFPVKRYAVVSEQKENPKPSSQAKSRKLEPESDHHSSESENSESEEPPPIKVKLKKSVEPSKKLKKIRNGQKVSQKEKEERKPPTKKRGRPPKGSVKKEEKIKVNFIPPIRPPPSTKFGKKKPDKKEMEKSLFLYYRNICNLRL